MSTLILACRSIEKGEAAKQSILASSPSSKASISVWQLDLADYASVKSFGKRIGSDLSRLDAIVLNAGLDTRDFSLAENNETTLTVNVVSTFLLGLLALPELRNTAKERGKPTHLTFLGSMIQIMAPFQELSTPPKGKIFSTLNDPQSANMRERYYLSKLMVMQLAEELAALEIKSTRSSAKIPTDERVIINGVNPGWCKTELFRNYNQAFMERVMLWFTGRTAEVGSRNLAHAATIAGAESHGQYLSECQVKSMSKFQQSSEGRRVQHDLWAELVEKLEKISPGVTNVVKVST